MRRLGGALTGLLVWLAALAVPTVALSGDACAAETPRAALVVDTGEGARRFCVALPDEEVSGLELIVLAGEQHGLSYRFGYGGAAVCMLAGVGTSGDDCFERYPDFWGYWRGSSEGGWTWSSTGAGGTTVSDGDVEGWAWGAGSDGSSHPRPPTTAFSSVCPAAPSTEEDHRAPSEGGGGNRGGSPGSSEARESGTETTAAPAPAAPREARPPGPLPQRAGRSRPQQRPRRHPEREARPARATPLQRSDPARSEATPATREVGADRRRHGALPPMSGLAALGAAAVLGGAGFVFTRRRRARP